MLKFAMVLLLASAFLIPHVAAKQAPPEMDLTAKAAKQTPPAPVTVPLSIGTAFNAALTDTLDTRRARPGDPVYAEIVEDVTYQRTVIFPKGTKIIGHVVRASSGGRGRTGSALFLQFDKAILKDGQEVMLNAGIQALAVGIVAPMSDPETNSAGQSAGLDTRTDGETERASAADTSTVGSDPLIVSTIYDTSRRDLRPPLLAAPAAQGELNSDGMFSPDSKGAFGRPDVKVYTPTSEGSHGTVLLSGKKHLHLDPGTRLLLVVQPPPSGEADPTAMINLNEAGPNP
jgi:hypothetical protein